MGICRIVYGAAIAALSIPAGVTDIRAGEAVAAVGYQLASSDNQAAKPRDQTEAKLTPEQKMQARFPQPASVSHLVGLPVLDGNDSTIGYVERVVKTPDGKVQLIVPFGPRFGWIRDGDWVAGERRLVALPIEAVEILALQIIAIDMDREMFATAPTWSADMAKKLTPDEIVKIAVGRR